MDIRSEIMAGALQGIREYCATTRGARLRLDITTADASRGQVTLHYTHPDTGERIQMDVGFTEI